MANFLAEKAKTSGVEQSIGPLNAYERRLVHLAVAEVPGATSESIGDAAVKTVTIIARRSDQSLSPWLTEAPVRMFSTDDTIVAIATPPGRGGIGVVRVSGRRQRVAAALLTSTRRFSPRHATFSARRRRRSGRRDLLSGSRIPTPARTSSKSARTAARSCFGRSSSRRWRPARGWPSRASSRCARFSTAARSRPGGGGRRSHRRRDAAAGARGVRSARRNADRRGSREIDAKLFDLIARLEASLDFPDEGYHFVAAGEAAAALAGHRTQDRARCSAMRGAGRLIREGAQVAIAGKPNVGQVEPVQRAARRRTAPS